MKSPAHFFRAGAGAAIIDARGRVLAMERSDIPGAWQLPQGGLKGSESPMQAAFREVKEETGIGRSDLELLDSYPWPLAYELPASAWSTRTGRGQVGHWFLFRFCGLETAIVLEHSSEFASWKWTTFDRLVAQSVDFRKHVYRQLQDRFRPYLRGTLSKIPERR
jgi:putative (di)nucleoside polyphosphate hydrolase